MAMQRNGCLASVNTLLDAVHVELIRDDGQKDILQNSKSKKQEHLILLPNQFTGSHIDQNSRRGEELSRQRRHFIDNNYASFDAQLFAVHRQRVSLIYSTCRQDACGFGCSVLACGCGNPRSNVSSSRAIQPFSFSSSW